LLEEPIDVRMPVRWVIWRLVMLAPPLLAFRAIGVQMSRVSPFFRNRYVKSVHHFWFGLSKLILI